MSAPSRHSRTPLRQRRGWCLGVATGRSGPSGPPNALGRDPSRVGARSPGPATPRERQIRTSRARPPTTSGARRTRTASPRATVSRDARDAYAFLRTAVRDLSWLARDCRDGNSSGSKNLTGHRGTLFRRVRRATPSTYILWPSRRPPRPREGLANRGDDPRPLHRASSLTSPSPLASVPPPPPPPRGPLPKPLEFALALRGAPRRLRRLRPSVFVRRRPFPIITHPRRHHRGVAMISRRRLRLLGDARRRVSSRKTFSRPRHPRRAPPYASTTPSSPPLRPRTPPI